MWTIALQPRSLGAENGKKSGRCIFDSSDGAPLNSDEACLELEKLYGAIEYPTLKGLVRMVLEYAAEMKQKLGAFTLLFFEPEGVRYLA